MILCVYIKYCVVMLAALRWVLIKTAGLGGFVCHQDVSGMWKANTIIHPAHKPRQLLTFYCKIHTGQMPESTGSKIKTSPVQCML